MRVNDVYILEEAVDDLNEGRSFYDLQEAGVGNYFWDCLIADIESLIIYAGIHRKKLGFYQMFAKRFPYAIYYEIVEEIAQRCATTSFLINRGFEIRRSSPKKLGQLFSAGKGSISLSSYLSVCGMLDLS